MTRDIVAEGDEAVIMPNPKLFTLISNAIGNDFDNFNREIFDAVITESTTDNGIRFTMFFETIIDIASSLTDITFTIDNVCDFVNCHHETNTYFQRLDFGRAPSGVLFGGRPAPSPRHVVGLCLSASPKHYTSQP